MLRKGLKTFGVAMLSLLPVLSGGCKHSQGGSSSAAPSGGLPSVDLLATVPLGQIAGAPSQSAHVLSIANPYEGNAQAIQEGKQLYIRMNCAGCHAYSGKGNMGPDLTDGEWRYGGLPVEIYKTIRDGRPQGMPAWGNTLPPDDIWKVVAYVQSLGGTVAVKDYEHARQGDQPGEQVAPEAQADARLAPPPPSVEMSTDSVAAPAEKPDLPAASVPAAQPKAPVVLKHKPQPAPPKVSEPQP